MKDTFNIHGAMTAQLFKPDGTIITTHKDNLIVSGGFDFIADAIGKATSRPGVMNTIAVGKGTTAVAASQTALVSQVLSKTATYSHTSGTKTFSFAVTFNAGEATAALTEAGVFNANGGTMLDRVVFSVINKGADDKLTVTFTFTMS